MKNILLYLIVLASIYSCADEGFNVVDSEGNIITHCKSVQDPKCQQYLEAHTESCNVSADGRCIDADNESLALDCAKTPQHPTCIKMNQDISEGAAD